MCKTSLSSRPASVKPVTETSDQVEPDDFQALSHYPSLIYSENRYPLFRMML